MPLTTAKPELVEWRGKIMKTQKKALLDVEQETGVPVAALVRMALASFLPTTKNKGFTNTGIKAGYLNGNY